MSGWLELYVGTTWLRGENINADIIGDIDCILCEEHICSGELWVSGCDKSEGIFILDEYFLC